MTDRTKETLTEWACKAAWFILGSSLTAAAFVGGVYVRFVAVERVVETHSRVIPAHSTRLAVIEARMERE